MNTKQNNKVGQVASTVGIAASYGAASWLAIQSFTDWQYNNVKKNGITKKFNGKTYYLYERKIKIIRIPDIILNTEISIYRKMGYDVKIIEVAGIYYTYMKKK